MNVSKTREVLEVLVVWLIMTALANAFGRIKDALRSQRAVSFQSDPTQPGLLEISGDTLSQFQGFWSSASALVLFVASFTNLFAIYYSIKNDDLLLSVRLILTGENLQRLVYTITQLIANLCTVLSSAGCTSDIINFIILKARSLSVVIAFCQMFVSFNRFMAVSFDGMLFKSATRKPLLQFTICYSLAISLFFVSAFTTNGIVNIYVTPTLTYFMITMDFFTFSKLRKLNDSKVSMAERRLMVQMIGSSTYYFMYYFVSSLITIVQYPFFGYFLSSVALQVNSNISLWIFTLGLSSLNMIYLKKRVHSLSEKERNNNSTTSQSVQSITVTRTTRHPKSDVICHSREKPFH